MARSETQTQTHAVGMLNMHCLQLGNAASQLQVAQALTQTRMARRRTCDMLACQGNHQSCAHCANVLVAHALTRLIDDASCMLY